MRSVRISRRAMLRGTGVAIGLPLLDAMLDSRGLLHGSARAQSAGVPLYFLTMMAPNGTYAIDWYPAQQGAEYSMAPKVQHNVNWLEPLAPHKDALMILGGLPKTQGTLNKDINNDGHARGTATFATGEPITATGAGSASVDQIAAAELGGSTKFRSVAAAIGGVTEPHWSYISWLAKDQPLAPYRDPAQLFTNLFSDFQTPTSPTPDPTGSPAPASSVGAYRQSVLDFVKADLSRLEPRLGVEDRARLEEHLSAIRELEKQVIPATTEPPQDDGGAAGEDGGDGSSCARPDAPATTPDLSNERLQTLLRLQVMAFACDLTRFGSFQMGSRADERVFSWLGFSDGHHTISHDYTPAGEAMRERMWKDEIEQLASLIELMKTTRISADATLLDRSIVFFASEHGENFEDGHFMGDCPVIVAGRGGGALKTGQHLRFDGTGYTYSDLLLTLLQVLGSSATSFGPYGTKPISSIVV